MGKNMFPSVDRLLQIERRQRVRKWNRFYEAAIRATRLEAPKKSRPSQILAPKLGRTLHALSQPEAAVFLLMLYAPTVEEALDQYALPTLPTPHFLAESPFVSGVHPAYSGTAIAAEELGVLKYHPMVKDNNTWLPFPLVGDLLVFHRKGDSVETVNLTIKPSQEDFNRPFQGGKQVRNRERENEKVHARHAIEEKCHRDVGVKTVRVAGDEVPQVLQRNLDWLNRTRNIPEKIPELFAVRVLDRLRETQLKGAPPMVAFNDAFRKWDIDLQQSKIIFAEAIFKRELRIDLLYELILVDQPLADEQRDALDIAKRWLE